MAENSPQREPGEDAAGAVGPGEFGGALPGEGGAVAVGGGVVEEGEEGGAEVAVVVGGAGHIGDW